MRKLIVTFVLILISSSASGRVVTGKIVDMVSWMDGHTAIKIENGPEHGCTHQYYYSLGIKGQDVKAEPMLSIALAAYLGNRTVTLLTLDDNCQGGQEKINSIQLKPE